MLVRTTPLALLLVGCGGPPVAEDLYGLWANIDDASTVRVLEFAESGEEADLAGAVDVYHLYNYPEGSSPTEVQRGTYAIEEGDGWELVTTVTADPDNAYVGQSFGNPIEELDGETLVLQVDDQGTTREYTLSDDFP